MHSVDLYGQVRRARHIDGLGKSVAVRCQQGDSRHFYGLHLIFPK